jgi:CBS-domain-containing membrane protein
MPAFLSTWTRRLPASRAPASPALGFVLWSCLGASLAIALTGWLSQASGLPWLMAPFGASCVLVFGLPDSPLAQPRSLIGGHLVASLVGLLVLHTLGPSWWAAGLAVGLALALMQLSRSVHAPAGADPLVLMAGHAGLEALLTPVLAGSLLILLIALAVNNLRQRGSYPKYWI